MCPCGRNSHFPHERKVPHTHRGRLPVRAGALSQQLCHQRLLVSLRHVQTRFRRIGSAMGIRAARGFPYGAGNAAPVRILARCQARLLWRMRQPDPLRYGAGERGRHHDRNAGSAGCNLSDPSYLDRFAVEHVTWARISPSPSPGRVRGQAALMGCAPAHVQRCAVFSHFSR